MLNRFAIIVCISFFLCSAFSAYAADESKIGVVDLQKIFKLSSAGKLAQAEIKKRHKEMEDALKKKGQEIEELKNDIERQSLVISKEQREKKERELDIKIYDLKLMKKRFNEELMEFQNERLEKLKEGIFDIVQEKGKKEGFLLIIEKISVLYAPSTIDITDELIKAYNERFSKK